MKFNIFINRKQWEQFDDETMTIFKEAVFQHYRETGFPYFNLSWQERIEDFVRVGNFNTTDMIDAGDQIKQVMSGLGFVNHYMPHMFEVRSGNFMTPLEAFNDDNVLRSAIDKRISHGDYMSDSGMRKVLGFVKGTQRVSNFRPTVAKFIYDKYNAQHVLDFSAGFGGRLMGACASNVKTYVGIEPCVKTYNALNTMADDLRGISDIEEINIVNKPFEDIEICSCPDFEFDMAFSSPPYYNTEKYSDEDTQSWMRYKTVNAWEEGFLKPTIFRCWEALCYGGYFIINVANVRTHHTLEQNTVRYALKQGFKHVETYKMRLSKLHGDGWKTEPIFVFKKER
jgi:16S rRNA G966 N2-methylase RsmD